MTIYPETSQNDNLPWNQPNWQLALKPAKLTTCPETSQTDNLSWNQLKCQLVLKPAKLTTLYCFCIYVLLSLALTKTGVSKWARTRYFYPPEIVYSTGRNYWTPPKLAVVKTTSTMVDRLVEYFSWKINDHVNCWILAFKSNNCVTTKLMGYSLF
jgi:hypothetical protein